MREALIYIVTSALTVYFVVALVASFTTDTGAAQSLNDLTDVIINNPVNTQVLAYLNGAWRNSDINPLINNLPWSQVSKSGSVINDLGNVEANPSPGQVLEWDGSQWIAGNDDTGSSITAPVMDSTYLVFRNSTGYYARNAATNLIEFSGSDPGNVITQALNTGQSNTKISFLPSTSHDVFVFQSPIIIQYDSIDIDCNEARLMPSGNNIDIIKIDPNDAYAVFIYIHNCKFDLSNKDNSIAINSLLSTSERLYFAYIYQNNFMNINSTTSNTNMYINLTNSEEITVIENNRFNNIEGFNDYAIYIKTNGISGSQARILKNTFTSNANPTYSFPVYVQGTTNEVGRIIVAFNRYLVQSSSTASTRSTFFTYDSNSGTSLDFNKGIIIAYNNLEGCNICILAKGTGNGAYLHITGNTFELKNSYNFTTGNNYGILINNTRVGAKITGNEFDVRRNNFVAIRSESPRPILISDNVYRTRDVSYASLTPYELTVTPTFTDSSIVHIDTEVYIENSGSITLNKGLLANPFGTNNIVPWGSTANPTNSVTYTAHYFTYMISISGGADVDIDITDANNNIIISNATTYTGILKPGWKITISYTTLPTIKVII